MTENAAPPHAPVIDQKAYERRWIILTAMCMSLVLVVATVSSVNVAIPSLATELRPTDTQILWIVDAYALVFAGLLLFSGSLGDRFGRKGALQVGLVIFALASTMCALSTSPNFLIAMRAVMGVGASLVMPSTLSLVMVAFPPQERAKAIAVWVGFAGAGASIGPIMGGFLLTHFWWGSVFFVPMVLAVFALVLSSIVAPKAKEPGRPRLDPIGAVFSVVGLSSFLFAIIEGPEKGWTSGLVLGGFVGAVVGIGGFVTWEYRSPAPMLDMQYFRIRRFAAGTVGITIAFLVMFSMFFVLTQYLQYVRGYSPLKAGIAGLPSALTLIAVSPRSTKLSGRIGIKPTVVMGMTTIGIGMFLMSLVGETTPYIAVAGALVVMAAGMGVTTPALSAGIVTSLPMHKAGVSSAVNDTTREVGGAMGIAVVGSAVTAVYRDHVQPALEGLPPEAAAQASKNVGRATRVAQEMTAQGATEQGASFLHAVRSAFIDGAHVGLRITGVLALCGAAFIAWRLPGDDRA